MSKGLLFWILMIVWVIFGVYPSFPHGDASWYPFGGSLLLFAIQFILGWQVFGFVVKD